MVTWIPSLVTSGVVVIMTVGSVIISMRIQLAKLESKFDAKFDAVEKDINRLEAKIDGINQTLGAKIDNVNQTLGAKIDNANQRIDWHLEGHA